MGRLALWLWSLICLLTVLVSGSAAFAADTDLDIGPPMYFGIVRSNEPGCEPNCPEWISAEGVIEDKTPALFKRVLKLLGDRKLPIVVDSPGGNVDAALALGRLIRKNKLDIAVGATEFSGCAPFMDHCKNNKGNSADYFGVAHGYGAMCNSACPLMFAGGVQRVVGSRAYLGVHQITTTYIRTRLQYLTTYRIVGREKKMVSRKVVSRQNAGSYKTYEMSKATEKKLSAFLKEMGIGDGVFVTIKNTPAKAIHQLALENMLQMNLVTSRDSVDMFTAADICKANPAAANCRKLPANEGARPVDVPPIATKTFVPAGPVDVPIATISITPAEPLNMVPNQR